MRRGALRVLLVIENMEAIEASRVWLEALALREAGCEVSIISPMGSEKHRERRACVDGIRLYRYQLPMGQGALAYLVEYGLAFVMSWWLSLCVLVGPGFDVLHMANPPDLFFLLGLFYRPLGKKFIYDQRDLMPEMFDVLFDRAPAGIRRVLRCALVLLERASYRVADAVIVCNESFKGFAIARGKCPPQKIFVVRNGPDPRYVREAEGHPPVGLKGNFRYLLAYVGVMGRQDGVANAIYALDQLVHRYGRDDVGLMLIGAGDEEQELRRLAVSLGLAQYTCFTGWVSMTDVFNYLAITDIGLVPDPKNGLSEYCTMIKTMEYMAMGKPVVGFDLAETRYSAQDAALYARANSIEDFADKINTLLDDPTLRARMGANGRRRVEQALSWEHGKVRLFRAYGAIFPACAELTLATETEPASVNRA